MIGCARTGRVRGGAAAREERLSALETIQSMSDTMVARMVNAVAPRVVATQLAKVDRRIYFRYFKGYRPDKVSRKRVLDVVRKEVVQGTAEGFAELLVVAWNGSLWELYDAMRKNVAKINPDVEAIERIEDDQAEDILADLWKQDFATEDIFLCVLLNDVRFTPGFRKKIAEEIGETYEAPSEEDDEDATDEAEGNTDAPAAEAEEPAEE